MELYTGVYISHAQSRWTKGWEREERVRNRYHVQRHIGTYQRDRRMPSASSHGPPPVTQRTYSHLLLLHLSSLSPNEPNRSISPSRSHTPDASCAITDANAAPVNYTNGARDRCPDLPLLPSPITYPESRGFGGCRIYIYHWSCVCMCVCGKRDEPVIGGYVALLWGIWALMRSLGERVLYTDVWHWLFFDVYAVVVYRDCRVRERPSVYKYLLCA